MAKKNKTQKSEPKTRRSGPFEGLGRRLDEVPQIQKAEAAVAAARAELEEAIAKWGELKRTAHDEMDQLRDAKLEDIVDGTLKQVRKHPGLGVLASVAVGFFLGRLFRR